jgi:hypothetical protein
VTIHGRAEEGQRGRDKGPDLSGGLRENAFADRAARGAVALMGAMTTDLDRAYRDHLTSSDRSVLAELGRGRSLTDVFAAAELEEYVFGTDANRDPLRLISPFLTFAVAVHRVHARLTVATYVEEWVGPRRRLPVFAVEPLRRLLADPLRQFFFVELLASYTHVVSGSTWTATRRGWRRRRFSELDPVQLAALLDAVPAPERPGVLRRLGDLALFLVGVFPDHTARTSLGRPLAEMQLLRAADVSPSQVPPGSLDGLQLLELLGARSYRNAARLSPMPSGSVEVLGAIADNFSDARRILNLVTDTFLLRFRDQWFGRPAA